jgi:nucleotide-binding universal stress UspA family protein
MGKEGRRIVVGVDFDVCGDDAIIEAIKLVASGWATRLHALHTLDPAEVLDDPSMPALTTEERVLEDGPDALRRRIAEVAEDAELSLPESALFVHVRLGKAAETLQQFAVDYDADLIVVGTHKRRGLERLLLGSVAQYLTRNASCPVLVARPKDHAKQQKTVLPDLPYAPGEEPAAQPAPVDRPMHISSERPVEPSTTVRIF